MNSSNNLSTPKRHHYVPQMLLRRFAGDKGMLHFFNKKFPLKGVLTSRPGNLFLEGHLYSQYSAKGVKEITLEKAFSKLEGDVDPILQKIILCARCGRCPNLTREEKEIWDLFFYLQWTRVPDTTAQIASNFCELLRETIGEFESTIRPLTEEEKVSLKIPRMLEVIKQNAIVKAIATPSLKVREILAQKGLAIVVLSKASKSFVIGSLPVVRFTLPGRAHLADPSVETWLPISSDVAVVPGFSRGAEKLIVLSDDNHIRRINSSIFGQSTMIAGRSAALIKSLSNLR